MAEAKSYSEDHFIVLAETKWKDGESRGLRPTGGRYEMPGEDGILVDYDEKEKWKTTPCVNSLDNWI